MIFCKQLPNYTQQKGIVTMKWMRQVALKLLQTRYADRFKSDFGVLPQEMEAKCGDAAYMDAVKKKVVELRKKHPQEWAHAEATAMQQGNFPGSGEPWKENNTQLQLERTQDI